MTRTENLNIVEVMPITSPKKLKDLMPVSESVIETCLLYTSDAADER